MTTRILLADSEPLFREGLAQLLRTQEDFRLVGEASDTHEAVEKTRLLRPDLVLVARDLPGAGGSETARRIHGVSPAARVIVLAPPRCEEEPCGGGVDAVLLRNVRASQVFAQIREIAGRGGRIERAPLVDAVFREPGGALRPEELTPRERAVFELVAEGWSNRQIEHALGIRESTVKRHVRRILRKLHVRNRVQAAVYAVQSSLYRREGIRTP